jgi:hypothetical protein
MAEIESKIITCEECFNIPKIIIKTKSKVLIECQKCKNSKIKDISYFDKFIYAKKDNFPELPKCSYNEAHESQSIKYCFQCTKYLCDKCIDIHKISFKDKTHILIDQKMDNQYYCDKEGHNEYIFDRYCNKCETYLCSQCKCEHNEQDIYNFVEPKSKQIINTIKNKVERSEEIIKNEEKKIK